MREPDMLEFPASEYKNRVDKLLSKMNDNSIDAVILTTKENTRYFTGYQIIIWDSGIAKPAVAVLTKDGDITMISGYSNQGMLEATTWVTDFRIWDPLGRDGAITNLPDCIYDVLQKKGIARGRIGMETGVGFRIHLNNMDYHKLIEHLDSASIQDISQMIWDIRAIKSPAEIEKIRKVCDINIKAFDSALNSIYPGMKEIELFRKIAGKMYELGADDVFPLGIRAGADRYAHGNSPPSDRPINKGEMLLIDGGPAYHGYHSDIIRQAIIGEPTERQKELYDFSVTACEKGLESIKPGITCGEVCKAVDDFIDTSGYGEQYGSRGWLGHSLGVNIHELPIIDERSNLVIKPGMVFAIEPYLIEAGVGRFGIEENILVTNDGYELLTPLSRKLRII